MTRPVDIQSYEHLRSIDRFAELPESRQPLGVFLDGPLSTGRAGFSFDFRGVREYQPGDQIKAVNYPASVRSGEWMVNEWEDEKSTNLMVISDMPRHAYRDVPGEEFTSRALGMLAAHAVMRLSINEGSPISAIWTNGYTTRETTPPAKYASTPDGIRQVLGSGISLSQAATEQVEASKNQLETKWRLFKKSQGVEKPVENQNIGTALERGIAAARDLMRARIVVISDFRHTLETPRGKDWSTMLRQLGENNQVITIEITNPLLRGLMPDQEDYLTGAEGVTIEASQQEAYKQIATKRGKEIQATLQTVSHKHVQLDTTESDWPGRLAAQLKSKQ